MPLNWLKQRCPYINTIQTCFTISQTHIAHLNFEASLSNVIRRNHIHFVAFLLLSFTTSTKAKSYDIFHRKDKQMVQWHTSNLRVNMLLFNLPKIYLIHSMIFFLSLKFDDRLMLVAIVNCHSAMKTKKKVLQKRKLDDIAKLTFKSINACCLYAGKVQPSPSFILWPFRLFLREMRLGRPTNFRSV